MSFTPTIPNVVPSSPSRHENLVGAILWLLPLEQVPDHGRYKLKAKACGHPCVVVQDCRATEPELVQICILASYSQSTSYSSLGQSEQHDHIPIHPNKPDGRVQPSILYLRHRQRTEMLLRKKSWVNTKRVYKVPVSILRPYETFQSWCRYRLAESSIQALQSALLISTLDSPTGPAASQSLFSPVSSEDQNLSDDLLSPLDIFWNPEGIPSACFPSPQTLATASETPASDDASTVLNEPKAQVTVDGASDSKHAPSQNLEAKFSVRPSVSLSDKQSPFHKIFPFDSGPHSKMTAECRDLTVNLPLLPPPVTTNSTVSRCKLTSQAKSIVCVCGAAVVICFLLVCLFVSTKTSSVVSTNHVQSWMSMAVDQVTQ